MKQEIINFTDLSLKDKFLKDGYALIHNPSSVPLRLGVEGADLYGNQWAAVNYLDAGMYAQEERGRLVIVQPVAAQPAVAEQVPSISDADNDPDKQPNSSSRNRKKPKDTNSLDSTEESQVEIKESEVVIDENNASEVQSTEI